MSGLPPRLARPTLSEAEAFAAFVGGWQLELWTTFHADGSRDYPFGRDAIGQIMYSADGHMTCHLMTAGRARLDEERILDVSDERLGRAMRGYTGYFGSFSIDAAAGIVTHHVAGAWHPDWIGREQPRHYAFEGDRLLLEAELGGDLARLVWRKRIAQGVPRLSPAARCIQARP